MNLGTVLMEYRRKMIFVYLFVIYLSFLTVTSVFLIEWRSSR